jgi:hypothetical protein
VFILPPELRDLVGEPFWIRDPLLLQKRRECAIGEQSRVLRKHREDAAHEESRDICGRVFLPFKVAGEFRQMRRNLARHLRRTLGGIEGMRRREDRTERLDVGSEIS